MSAVKLMPENDGFECTRCTRPSVVPVFCPICYAAMSRAHCCDLIVSLFSHIVGENEYAVEVIECSAPLRAAAAGLATAETVARCCFTPS